MVVPPTKHLAVYVPVALGAVAYALWSLSVSNIMPPGLQGRQLWFVDMMDSQSTKAYEAPMRDLPEGVVSRNRYSPNASRGTPEGEALASPHASDDAFLARGKWAFDTYCTPCHGPDGKGGGAVMDNSGGKKRYPVPAPALQGAGGVAKMRSDPYIYLTIRNGGAIMPAYNWAMDDEDMWAVVAYIRTLPETAYTPPAAPAPQ